MAAARFVELAQEPSPDAEFASQARGVDAPALRQGPKYRGGFSTSICSLFSDPSRRNDCCALALCGILSTDRTRYLLNQETPSWLWRISCHIVLPFGLWFVDRAVVKSMNAKQIEDSCNEVFEDKEKVHETEVYYLWVAHVALLLALGVTLLVIFIRSRIKRSKLRAELMTRVFENFSQTENAVEGTSRMAARSEMVMANRPFECCYSAPDKTVCAQPFVEAEMDNENKDLCGLLWRALAACCCASCCGCWCQCCGMCAAGQEEREMNALVPKEKLLMDYVTFEPFAAYFPSLEHIRQTQEGDFLVHCRSLSVLSSNILKGGAVVFACMLIFSLTDIDANFTLKNMLVLIATLLQAVVVLYLVHWRWNRFDLSLDAVIKYFASGFIFGTSIAVVVELLIGLVINIFIFVVFLYATIFELSFSEKQIEDWSNDPLLAFKELLQETTWIFVLYTFLNAFVIAAVTEELCKYFSFWMVEHPDLMPRSHPGKSLNSTGTGITIAMVTAAVGFACCENIGYVFSSSKVEEGETIHFPRMCCRLN